MARAQHLFAKFTQNNVRLLLDQLTNPVHVHGAGPPALRHTLVAASGPLRGEDLPNPAVADIEPLGQLPQRPLAGRIRDQHLFPQIVTVRLGHSQQSHNKTATERIKSYTPEKNALERSIESALHLSQRARRDDRGDAAFGQVVQDGIGIVALVGEHGFRPSVAEQRKGLGAIVGLAAGKHEAERQAEFIGEQVDFRR